MHLLHILPAALCLIAAAMMGLTIRDDLTTGTLRWRDREMGLGWAIIAACMAGAGVSFSGAMGVL